MAAGLLMLVGQDLAAPWQLRVMLYDASESGGGICETVAKPEECRAEARWAVRGGWTKFLGDTEVFNFNRPPERQEPEGYRCPIPRSVRAKEFAFVHLFSWHRREGDLEWFLIRLGAERRFRVAGIDFDKAYGDQFDLGDDEVITDLVEKGRAGMVHVVHNGAPCPTWSAARFAPGGPPPLRTRDSRWGLPGLSRKDREHVDLHSKLLRGSWDVLAAVAAGGGSALNEHPADRGRHPYLSAYATAMVQGVERRRSFTRASFHQCMVGAQSRKDTTLSGNLRNMAKFANIPKCNHGWHEPLIGLDSEGKFRTRQAQAYPPDMCRVMAEAFIDDVELRDVLEEEWLTADEIDNGRLDDDDASEPPDLGVRVPCPEVSSVWDKLSRWQETRRWKWTREEHNNVLAGRAGLASLTIATKDFNCFGRRALMIGDSQVVIGAFSKGRSSRPVINHLCRRFAAITLGLKRCVSWRFIRTHRNHADGPSRGHPVGVAPSSSEPTVADAGHWCRLPDFFYHKTKG